MSTERSEKDRISKRQKADADGLRAMWGSSKPAAKKTGTGKSTAKSGSKKK